MPLVIQTFWLLVPAGVANCCVSVSRFVFPCWITPLDFGLKFQEKRIFGNHKSCRGLLVGVIGSSALLVSYFFFEINFYMIAVALLLGLTLHFIVRYLGFLIGAVDKKF